MRTLLATMIQILSPFAPLFSKRVWQHAQVLLAGAILAPGRRTVSSALRVVGLDQQERFHRYHRVLSRATWSPTKASRILLELSCRRSHPKVRWLWVSTRHWNDAGGGRSLQRESIETPYAQPASAS